MFPPVPVTLRSQNNQPLTWAQQDANTSALKASIEAVAAVVSAMQDTGKESFLVTEFPGGTWDGVADDAAAIQAAFNAANGTGRKVVFNVAKTKIGSPLSQNNHSHYDVDWGECRVQYAGANGTYMLDKTQAGRVYHWGGVFTGSGANNLLMTAGSAAAQAVVVSSSADIPAETLWTRQCAFVPRLVSGFADVFTLGNFTREYVIGGVITGNLRGVVGSGKVVNLTAMAGTLIYSGISGSRAIYFRGESFNPAYRYAEGLFFSGIIMDTVGKTVDVRDVYLFDLSGAQVKTASGGIAVDITRGVCFLTRQICLERLLSQGRVIIGAGLSSGNLFDAHLTSIGFSDTTGVALTIGDNSKGVYFEGGSFNSPVGGSPVACQIGANCVGITFRPSYIDAAYTTPLICDPSSTAGLRASFRSTLIPVLKFGGTAQTSPVLAVCLYEWNGGCVDAFVQYQIGAITGTGAATMELTGLPNPSINGVVTIGKFSGFTSPILPFGDIAPGGNVVALKSGCSISGALNGTETLLTHAWFSANMSILNMHIRMAA